MKVLFCTDGSKISYNAIQNFSYWIENSVIDIINVFDLRYLPDFISLESNNWESLYNSSADKILDYTEIFLKDNNLTPGEKFKMCGSTVDNIHDKLTDYDFVVLGSNGKKGIQKWLGSVSYEIAAISDVPVFISKESNNRQKVLFAVENTLTSQSSVEDCIKKLELYDKEIYLATVYEIPEYLFLEGNLDFRWIKDVQKKQERDSSLLLHNIERLFKDCAIPIKEKFILKGIPTQEIIKTSQKYDIDLIVTGTNKKKPLSKILFSSVSMRILNNAFSDVIVFKY